MRLEPEVVKERGVVEFRPSIVDVDLARLVGPADGPRENLPEMHRRMCVAKGDIAHIVDGEGGDRGVDIYHGDTLDFDKPVARIGQSKVWKYQRLSDYEFSYEEDSKRRASKKNQIVKSVDTAFSKWSAISEYYLITTIENFNVWEADWWAKLVETTLAKHEELKRMYYIDGSAIRAEMENHPLVVKPFIPVVSVIGTHCLKSLLDKKDNRKDFIEACSKENLDRIIEECHDSIASPAAFMHSTLTGSQCIFTDTARRYRSGQVIYSFPQY